VPNYILPNVDNRIHDFIATPREMLHLSVDVAINCPMLMAARQVVGSLGGPRPYNYYLYDYIGNLLYCLEFVVNRTQENLIRADPVHSRLLVHIEAILPGQALPPDGINRWVLLQCEDALIGEGGDVIRLVTAPSLVFA
jgi:hypothetical protein